tara:strand:+ start:66 stop:461 length:396 start_codon:yes stop_codon:yes gene_type:complete
MEKIETRTCKLCNIIKNLKSSFYKTSKKKDGTQSYQNICKPCYSKRNSNNTDNDLLHYENDFVDLPLEIKIKIVELDLNDKNLKRISRTVKCKYFMLWYALKAKQIEQFAILYIKTHPYNKYGLRMKKCVS